MGLDPGALIKKLDKTCLDGLHAAAGFCLSRTNPSVEIEHWLLKLLDTQNPDQQVRHQLLRLRPSRPRSRDHHGARR